MFSRISQPAAGDRGYELRGKGFGYAPMPMLLIDAGGVLAEMNVAARVLFGAEAAGAKGRPVALLEQRLGSRLHGRLIPAGGLSRMRFGPHASGGRVAAPLVLDTRELRPVADQCRYDSPRFGAAVLGVLEVPYIETQSGRCSGSMVSLEIQEMASMDAYRRAIVDRQTHDIMWEVYAASYDRILPRLKFYRQAVRRHCAALLASPIDTILDVGAGTGIVAAKLLRHGRRVTAVDTSPAMLARLRARVAGSAVAQLAVVEDTAEYMPYLEDAGFDGVTALLSLFDMQNPEAALGEVMRVLRPGGTVIITEPRACFDVEALMRAAQEQLRQQGLLDRLAEDWERIQVVAPLIKDAVDHGGPSAAGRRQAKWHAGVAYRILDRAGYTGLTVRRSHLGNCATICACRPT